MTELKNIEVREVSLVDAGANPEANILFFKRKQEENTMAKNDTTPKDVNKQEELKSDVADKAEDVSKAAEAASKVVAEKENTELKKRVAELEKALAERDAADKAAIEKAAQEKSAADNAEISAAFERLNKRFEEYVAKAEDAELLKVASKYEVLGENAEQLSATLKKMKAAGVYDEYVSKLDRELAYVEKSGTFSEIGKSGYNSQAVSIEKYAAQIRKADPSLTERQALDKAFQEHPELEH